MNSFLLFLRYKVYIFFFILKICQSYIFSEKLKKMKTKYYERQTIADDKTDDSVVHKTNIVLDLSA